MAVLVVMLAACSPRDEAASNLRRYCDLSRQYNAELEASIKTIPLSSGEVRDIDEAHQRFVKAFEDRFRELEQVAPGEIRRDVAVYYRAVRAGEFGRTRPGSSDAEDRIERYNQKQCGIAPP